MRKAEVVAAGTEHETYLPARQVALDDDVYYIVKQAHERLGHASKKTYEAVHLYAYGINRDEVEWFTGHCRRCELNGPNCNRAPLQTY
jgi:hypothetical protein